MIEITFLKLGKTGEICGYEISGHANYAEHGKDIICSAVSSAAYMVINTLVDVVNVDADVEVNDDGYMHIFVYKKYVSDCKILFEGLKLHFISLEEIYPQNIKVNYQEVEYNVND